MVTQAKRAAKIRAAAFARAAAVAAVVVGLDQIAKAAVRSGIPVGEERRFFIGIQLVHVRNIGVAFSLVAGGGTLVLCPREALLDPLGRGGERLERHHDVVRREPDVVRVAVIRRIP